MREVATRKDWRGTRWTRGWLPGAGGVGGRLPRRRALLGPRLPGRLPRTPGGMPTEALDAQVWKSEQPAAALSAGGRGQMLSQALRRKSQAIFLLWLGVST